MAEGVDYDPATQTLGVKMKPDKAGAGATYAYDDVSPEEFKELMGADSFGRHFAHHIKGKPCKKL